MLKFVLQITELQPHQRIAQCTLLNPPQKKKLPIATKSKVMLSNISLDRL